MNTNLKLAIIGLTILLCSSLIVSAVYFNNTTIYLTVPTQEASYIIGQYNSTHYFAKNHTGYGTVANMGYEFLGTNKTLIEYLAISKCVGGGLVWLKDIQHSTTLAISANVMVMESYLGNLKYYKTSSSGKVGDCPVATTGIYSHLSNTDEQTMLSITPTAITQLYNFYFDVTALTHNATIRVYSKINNSTWTLMSDMSKTAMSTDAGLILKGFWINTDFKITMQSDFAEGATRSIPYRYFSETW